MSENNSHSIGYRESSRIESFLFVQREKCFLKATINTNQIRHKRVQLNALMRHKAKIR